MLKFKKNTTDIDLKPIDKQPEYRSKLDLVDRLKTQQREVQAEKDTVLEVLNSACTSRTSGLSPLTQNYLEGGRADVDMRTRQEKLATLNRQFNALSQAIEVAEKDLQAIRLDLSAKTAAEQKSLFIAHARIVLEGMLLMQKGNESVEELCQQRKDLGYAEVFHPVGIQWPQWGSPTEENSVWRMILREFLEAEIITGAEHHRLINGHLEL